MAKPYPYTSHRPSNVESMVSLRVDNLPYTYSVHGKDVDTSLAYLRTYMRSLFVKYGDIGDIHLPTYKCGRFRGYAFVRYYNKRDAENALHGLYGRKIGGRELMIKIDNGLTL